MDATFTMGGIVYRSMVCTEHMGTVVSLARSTDLDAPRLGGLDYRHSSNLPLSRATWLEHQVRGSDRWAVSMDSDTWCDAEQLQQEIALVRGGIAIGIVPVVIGGTEKLNVLSPMIGEGFGNRFSVDGINAAFRSQLPVELTAGGFGVAVFNLNWFRVHWSAPSPERAAIDSGYGEDIEMCLAVRRRGGRVIALPVNSWHKDLVMGGVKEFRADP